MNQVFSHLKQLFKKGKDTKTVIIDTSVLVTIGFIVIYAVCDVIARNAPLGSNLFERWFPMAFSLWIAFCLGVGFYTKTKISDKESEGDKKS